MTNKPKNSQKTIKSLILAIIMIMVLITPDLAKASSFELASFAMSPIIINPDSNGDGPTITNLPENTRAQRIDDFFADRDMPLAGFGDKFVKVADACGLDWRLLPAISIRESSGGKHLMNRNPFGWGSAKIPFKNFNEAIEVVSKNLCGLSPGTAQYYKDKTVYEKLWAYNGTVLHSYPDEVIAIMKMF